MRKITFLLILLTVSAFALADSINVTDSGTLATALADANDGDVINLAAGNYYPPEVTMTFTDYWTDPTGSTTIDKTFNAFVVPGVDITISGTTGVIFDRTVGGNDWQMAFVFYGDGDAVDEAGITFENFTVQNLDYGLVNHWPLTENYNFGTEGSPVYATTSRMEYTNINNIDFTDIVESAIIIEPRMYYSSGSKGSNNTVLFSRDDFDWNSRANIAQISKGKWEEFCEIGNCTFTDIIHKSMVSDVGVKVYLHDNTFDSGWRGFHFYTGGAPDPAWNDQLMLVYDNTFLNFDGDLYPGIAEIQPVYQNGTLVYQDSYFVGRAFGFYYQSARGVYMNFQGNYYEAKNGSVGCYTDGLRGENNTNETYNYIGSPGWIKDLHNVRGQINMIGCNFYIYDEGLGIIITKQGNCQGEDTPTHNPSDEEYYTYVGSYGTVESPVNVQNCNFLGYNINHTLPGSGSGIFLADWEHYSRDGYGVTQAYRNGESFMHISNTVFQNLYAGIFLDAGRPDQLYGPEDLETNYHDDGRLQVYATESKFINCTNSVDFTIWDQWVRTNSYVILEKNYFGGVDPYSTFNFASDFPAMDGFYDLNLSTAYSGYSIGDTRTYTTGIASSPITHSVYGGDDYRVHYPQFLQYLPYYKDEDMTELSGLEVANLSLDGTTLSWNAVYDTNAKYAVYYSAGGTSSWTQIGSYTTSTSVDVSGLTADYYKVAVVIPNQSEGAFYGTGDVPTYTVGEYPIVDFDFVAGVSTFNTVDFEYGSEDDYAVSQIGVIEKTLDIEGTKYYLISLPFNGNYDTATALYSYLGLDQNTDTVSHWDVETQGWETINYSATLGWDEPFSAEVNDVYMLNVELATDESIDILLQGSIPESPVYNMITTNATNLNFIMLPINSNYATAEALGAAMGTGNTIMISQWDETYQSWESCVYISEIGWINSFSLTPGQPIVVGAVQNFTWPVR